MNTKIPALALTLTLANVCMAAPMAPAREISPADELRGSGAVHRASRLAGAASQSALALDTTAPAMSAFNAATVVDVTNGNAALNVNFTAADDLSGVSHGYGRAVGPSGQELIVQFYEAFPTKRFSGRMVTELLPAMLEPGEYTFNYAHVHDVLHNAGKYEGAALAALGNVRFVVKNRKGYDAKAPALVAGKVLTSVMSVSAHQKGTLSEPPRMGIALDTLDSGNTAIAGLRSAQADFCLADQSSCIHLGTDDSGLPGRAAMSTRVGERLYADTPVGEYHLYSVYLADYAGNATTLTSTEFGGTTNFSVYFPSTTITVTP